MNSVQQQITGATIANEVRLEGAVHEGSFLLVEGNDDAKLLSKFCDKEKCSILVCFGRERLLDAITILEKGGFYRALAIADRDFADIIDYPEYEGVVIFSDETDMDIMIFQSPALDHVLLEFGAPDRVAAIEAEGKRPRDLIFAAAKCIGALRLLSQERGLSLRFAEMNYHFETRGSFQINVRRTIQHIVGRSTPRPSLSDEAILCFVENHMNGIRDDRLLCNGHDCLRVLGKALKSRLGNTIDFDSGRGSKMLGSALRLAYEKDYFKRTKVCHSVRTWEEITGFNVLQ
ncbi:MAG: DUF4435 domain-containing protein [Defluviicoccus sp.]|nr:DUF4435 domain-containing protein [Defluviicoccus sp.]